MDRLGSLGWVAELFGVNWNDWVGRVLGLVGLSWNEEIGLDELIAWLGWVESDGLIRWLIGWVDLD